MFALLALAILQLRPPSPEVAFLQPQLASAPGLVALAFGSGKGVYVSTSTNEGRSFSDPVEVARADVLLLGHHRGPRVAIAGGVIVVSAVTGGDLVAWRSTDGGRTWSKSVAISDVPGSAREGLHTLAASGRGNVFAAWLDLRKPGTRLYGSRSTDAGLTWSPNVLIYESPDGSICQCCHPSTALFEDGEIGVMWRNALGGSRDLYLARSSDGKRFGPARKLGMGTWRLDACPMDGGGLAVSRDRVVTAWRRGSDIFLAEPGKSESRVGEGKDVTVALSQNQVYALWSNGQQIEVWVSGKREVLANTGAFPTVTNLPGGGVLAAWEDQGAISVHRLP